MARDLWLSIEREKPSVRLAVNFLQRWWTLSVAAELSLLSQYDSVCGARQAI
jgi:hypothetical protein